MNGDVNNLIGDRGEAIFESVMTKFHGASPLFRRPRFMGEKWPDVDYVCELLGPWKTQKPFFFIQVKATGTGYTKREQRLKVQISKGGALTLAAYKAPAYVAGVDTASERVYIIAAAGRIKALSSIHTGTELNAAGRRMLWEEVRQFWARVSKPTAWTKLKDPSWK
jgi:hypothetical protein